MLDDATMRSHLRALSKRMENLRPIMSEIGAIIIGSIDENFEVGGRFGNETEYGGGSQKWPVSKRAQRTGDKTLIDQGIFKDSWTYRVEGNDVVVGSIEDQAAAMHFGMTFETKEGVSITIPPRPIAVLQKIDLTDIHRIIIEYYSKVIGS